MRVLIAVCMLLFSVQVYADTLLAVAANMNSAAQELAKEYKKVSGHSLLIISASSGKLTGQIMKGAEYDIFLSADMEYPQELFARGFAVAKPEVYASGMLVIWSATPNAGLADPASLASPRFSRIAIANPKVAPYGREAVAALVKAGLWNRLNSRFVYGESIAQTNQFIMSGAAQAGITSLSSVAEGPAKGVGSWIPMPEHLYTKIAQGMVLLKRAEKNPVATGFVSFMRTPQAKGILKRFGYEVSQ